MKRICMIALILCVILVSGCLLYKANSITKNTDKLVYKINSYQKRIDSKRAYLSKENYRFSKEYAATIQEKNDTMLLLEQVFKRLSSTEYAGGYEASCKYAEKYIVDRDFLDNDLATLKDVINSTNLKMKNISVEVTSSDNGVYTVITTSIPYYAKSDLYQEKNLKADTMIYKVSCVGTKISKISKTNAKLIQ